MKFNLQDFLPYLLNRAAEKASRDFQAIYKNEYGMLRTEWRVVFHLGQYGPMTARDICTKGGLHKTKVSRAVAALETKRYLKRQQSERDRREEVLSLTSSGESVFRKLEMRALEYQKRIAENLSQKETDELTATLRKLIAAK